MTLHEDALEIPLYWKNPKIVYVNTMSDLFHKDVPLSFLQRIFEIMGRTPQHTYHVLAKRSDRLVKLAPHLIWHRNICMGVSVENDRYTFRADHLRQVPAQARFVQLEPLLGPVPSLDLTGIDWVVAGGENGPGARPLNKEWLRDVEKRCEVSGTKYIEPHFETVPLPNVNEFSPGFKSV